MSRFYAMKTLLILVVSVFLFACGDSNSADSEDIYGDEIESSSENDSSDDVSADSKSSASDSDEDSDGKDSGKSSGTDGSEKKSSSSTEATSSSAKGSSESKENAVIKDLKLSGYTQKGPFVIGAEVTAVELADGKTLSQTGKVYTGEITRKDGLFNINVVSLASQYVILRGNGVYRNEVTGKLSDKDLKLNAITDLTARDHANINLITHMEFYRVQQLVQERKISLEEAKNIAKAEVYKAFHIDSKNFKNATEDLNIFTEGDENGALLAISILMQRHNDVGSLGIELSQISNELAEDGEWKDSEKRMEIAAWADSVDLEGELPKLRANVASLTESGVVPHFEKFIRMFWSVEYSLGVCGSDSVPVGTIKAVPNKMARGGKLYASSYEDKSITADRFICVDADLAKWRLATNFEKDTYEFECDKNGNAKTHAGTFDPGTLLSGRINEVKEELDVDDPRNLQYVCDDGKIRSATEQEQDFGKACISAFAKPEYMQEDDFGNKYAQKDERGNLFACGADGKWKYVVRKGPDVTQRDAYNETATYSTVYIGDQLWLAENLKGVFQYMISDNTRFYPYDPSIESSETSIRNDDGNVVEGYGRLYTWAAALNQQEPSDDNRYDYGWTYIGDPTNYQGVCPEGFRLPNENDWNKLMNFGTKITPMAKSDPSVLMAEIWNDSPNTYGFSAMPAGTRYYPYCRSGEESGPGCYFNVGSFASWWAVSTKRSEVPIMLIDKNAVSGLWEAYIAGNSEPRENARSVRCLVDIN